MSDSIQFKIQAYLDRINGMKAVDDYFYNQTIEAILDNTHVQVAGRAMLMFASYSYLGLLGHPRINAAAQAAIGAYGTGTHGVRILAGTEQIHRDLEATIARFKNTEDAVTFSSGYVTNLTAVSLLVGRHDVVICDKLNHASIMDGCLLSGAELLRFRHNDMAGLEKCLQKAGDRTKLVVVDAVFSMDGDIINLPRTVELCRQYDAWLMVDEAHSLGVLGATGHGIEEHFGLENVVDVKMGTLSKAIPSVGGYIAGSAGLVHLFKHVARAYVFSAALPPAQAAAAQAAFEVLQAEPERLVALRRNTQHFMHGLRQLGFDTMQSETAIVPILCGPDERAYAMVRHCLREDIFAMPVVSPAVPEGLARVRTTVTAAHSPAEIDHALAVLERAGRAVGILPS